MSRTSEYMDPDLYAYLVAHGVRPDPLLMELAEETLQVTKSRAGMQISPEQGAFLTLVTRLVRARTAVEVGTFTGYSALCIARGLAPGGRLLCCDVSEEWTAMGRRYWERDGVADRIDLRIAPALDTLRALPRDPVIDLSFIDANKDGYVDYWEELVPRTRPGGLLVVDNVLMHGSVLTPGTGADANAIHVFNTHAFADERVELVMLPLADGVTLARRR